MSLAMCSWSVFDGLTNESLILEQNTYRGEYHDYRLDSAYQPIISPTHKRIVGFEALIRCSHPDNIPNPKSLFELASSMNESVELDHLTRMLHLLNFQAPAGPFWLFLNVHTHILNHGDLFLEALQELLTKVNIKPEQIVLEILEDSIHDTDKLNHFVNLQRDNGFLIAIDDFGAGESNFNRIWEIQPDIVKLDRSLLTKAETNPAARRLLPGIVALLKRNGCLVLFEGVETENQLEMALESEVDMMQGYYFAKPSAHTTDTTFNPEALEQAKQNHHKNQINHKRAKEAKARRLRFEVNQVAACLEDGVSLAEACESLLTLPVVKRCFLLNSQGIQKGDSICGKVASLSRRFHPLMEADGASWTHREYFQHAIATDEIFVSEEYIALPDAVSTMTVSKRVNFGDQVLVLCVDLAPEYLLVAEG